MAHPPVTVERRPRLGVVIGTTRPGRCSPTIAAWVADMAKAHDLFDVELLDIDGLPLIDEPSHPSADRYVHDHTRRWSEQVDRQDAFVFVVAEYNRGVPAPLKNAVDMLYAEWRYKAAGIVTYGGASSGVRGGEQLRQALGALNVIMVSEAVAIPLRQRLDASGVLRPDDTMRDAASAMLDSLGALAEATSTLRHGTAIRILSASPGDVGEIVTLQRAAFLADAQIYADPFLPSLTQTVDEVTALLTEPSNVVLIARRGHRIVGSVRAEIRDGTATIGRLMTAPDLHGQGIGSQLMAAIEHVCAVDRYELHTGRRSLGNIGFYQRLGYGLIDETEDEAQRVTLAKTAPGALLATPDSETPLA